MLCNPFFPTQSGFRSSGAVRDSRSIFLVQVIYPQALIPGFADVADCSSSQKGEIKRRFKIETSVSAEKTFFRFGDIRLETFSKDESTIITHERLRWLLKLKATSREAGWASNKHFFLNW